MSDSLRLEFDVVTDESPISVDTSEYETLCRYVLGHLNQSGLWVVTVALVGDDDLRALHAQFMDDDSVTDVMTFPAGEPGQGGGDIVISVERAADQGPEHGLTTQQEVRFLFVHGLLHLCGWDDRSPEERERMLARQRALLRGFDEGGTMP